MFYLSCQCVSPIILLLPFSVLAETIVISGELLNDLRRTPVLGGGFSLTTEDYKSLCFDNVETSTPSYDYEYSLYSSEEEIKSSNQSSGEYGLESQVSGFFGSGGGQKANVQEEQSSSVKLHTQKIFVVIRLNSYYAALNESKSTLSVQARELLQSEDVIGFFDACGTYYIRTINRQSRIYAWLTLTSKETSNSFKSQLEMSIQSSFLFGTGGMKSNSKISTASQNFFKGKQLSIKIVGIGLGKEHIVNLSPSSIEDFKKVISNASKSMSGIHTGRITSIEIIPWMDNLSFQYELTPLIVAQEVPLEENATPEAKKVYLDKQKSLSLKRKWIVAENGEFISMLKNKYRALQAYQFSTMNCQSKLERIITRREDLATQGKEQLEWGTIAFKNHLGYGSITAKRFYEKLQVLTGNRETKFATTHPTEKSDSCKDKEQCTSLYKQWQAISAEADNCLAELYPKFTTNIYREIPKCKNLIPKLTTLMPEVLFYNCAPVEE